MTREEVLARVKAQLADELDLEAAGIADDARFKEDLNADSLHLVELVMELEDNYGVRIPDEDARKIKTVGQAVDYVIANSAIA